MRRRRDGCANQAVRPDDLGDVEEEGEGVEGERGEEPGEVHVQSEQRRGEGGRKDEEPQKMVPEEGVGQRMRSIGDPRLPTQAEVDNHNITHVP